MLRLVQTLLKPRRCRIHLDSRFPDRILTLLHRLPQKAHPILQSWHLVHAEEKLEA